MIEYPVKIKLKADNSALSRMQNKLDGGGSSDSTGGTIGGGDGKTAKKQTGLLGKMAGSLGVIGALLASLRNILQPILELVEWLVVKGISTLIEWVRVLAEKLGNLWENIKENFGEIWSNIKEKFSGLWERLKAGWEIIKQAGQWIWENVIVAGWERLKSVGQWIFDNVIKPAWETLKTVGTWIWENVIRPAWESLKTIGTWVWENVIKPAWEGLKTVGQWIWNSVIKPAFEVVKSFGARIWELIKTGFEIVKDFGTRIWELIKTGFEYIKDIGQKIYNDILRPAFEKIGGAIRGAVDKIRNAASRIPLVGGFFRSNAFGGTVTKDGLHMLHQGERITSVGRSGRGGSTGNMELTINVNGSGRLTSREINELAQQIGQATRSYTRF